MCAYVQESETGWGQVVEGGAVRGGIDIRRKEGRRQRGKKDKGRGRESGDGKRPAERKLERDTIKGRAGRGLGCLGC